MGRFLGATFFALAGAAAATPAGAQIALSSDARCFVANIAPGASEKKAKDRQFYESNAMFFLGRLDAHREGLPDLDVDQVVSEMSEDEFVSEVKRCLDEVSGALDMVGGKVERPD